jgi:hypothetical protein
MRRGLTLLLWVFLAAMRSYSYEPPAAPCASCHPLESKAYAQTRMASAMVPVLESAFAQNIESLALSEPGGGYQFRYKKNASNVTVISWRGSDSAVGAIDWVLGSGAQGQTPIVKAGRTLLESRVSFFPNLRQYGITIGQSAAASANAIASLGRPQTSAEVSQCLGCHATALDATFTKIVPGVQCEKCHPGASLHASGKGMPVNPGKLLAGEQVRLCGNCHRNSAPVDEGQLENIRFQPLRLMKSRCFESGKIACTTCHPAHQDARRDAAAFYNAKCLACHAASHNQLSARDHVDCVGCHMPQIQLHPALRFTDHFIRVVRSTDYPSGSIVQRQGEFR